MKGWKTVKPYTIEQSELTEPIVSEHLSKVKITKALITLSDVLKYMGKSEMAENIVLGKTGLGIVSETSANLFGLEKGKHVYVDPNRECKECFNCKSGSPTSCSDLAIAGEDFDGFLSDFVLTDAEKLFLLPESVSDLAALFIEHISLAVAVVDKLNIQKGDYVAIIGANNFANILAQLLIYYQAVPIVVTNNDEDYKIAKDSGVYYVLGKDDNWQKEVSIITSGRMTSSAVYVSDCNISFSKAVSLVSYNAKVAFTGSAINNNPISFNQAIRKQLEILCINNGFGNIAASINLIANKAINLSYLKLDTTTFTNVPETLENMSKMYENEGKIYETIVDFV